MAKKLLILGGTGLVGSTLTQYATSKFDIHITSNQNENKFEQIPDIQINFLEEYERLVKTIKSLKPNFIVHTVAYPSVDFCENHKKEASFLHIGITDKIALASKEINSKLIFLSTDAVFDGELNKKYTELDEPNPINYYAKTKLEAEKIVLEKSKRNVVLRTAVIYGWHDRSRFTNWIISSLSNNKIVDPFIDQYNTPTLVNDLVNVILKIMEKGIDGLYHAAGKTCINRYEFALTLAKKFGLNEKLIKPVTSSEKKQVAPRPISTCLDSTNIEKLIDYDFSDIEKGISFLHKQWKAQKKL